MKRELKHIRQQCQGRRLDVIAEPIPMKRELKLPWWHCNNKTWYSDCRAYPDEKGIETHLPHGINFMGPHNCRAYPDEKGIETDPASDRLQDRFGHCRAYPDEKGIETSVAAAAGSLGIENCRAYPDEKGIETDGLLKNAVDVTLRIAEPIPMKRELKPLGWPSAWRCSHHNCRAYPDEKGIETSRAENCLGMVYIILQSLSR